MLGKTGARILTPRDCENELIRAVAVSEPGMNLRKAFVTYFWPALAGLLGAVLLIGLYPERFGAGAEAPTPFTASQPDRAETWVGPVSYADAVKRAAPSVVSIYSSIPIQQTRNPLLDDPFFRQFFNNAPAQEELRDIRSGAGIVVTTDGHILTNKHLIDGADQIVFVTSDGRQSAATLVGVDAETDIAVLKSSLDGLKPIGMGDPESVEVGDVVLAIGNPFGKGQTVTQGIVSATGRNLMDMDLSAFVNFLQTDAAINEGNSGGALIDVFGNLIGINTAVADASRAEGISFAIPADMAMDVVRSLVTSGTVIRGWVGIQANELTSDVLDSLQLDLQSNRALLVTGLDSQGPAQAAGVMPGDIIVGINGQPLNNGRQVLDMISNTPPGQLLTLALYRDGQLIEARVRAAVRPTQ